MFTLPRNHRYQSAKLLLQIGYSILSRLNRLGTLKKCLMKMKRTSFSARHRLREGCELVDVEKDPGKVADQVDQDDGQEDGGQAVLLAPHQTQVGRVAFVRALQARAALGTWTT